MFGNDFFQSLSDRMRTPLQMSFIQMQADEALIRSHRFGEYSTESTSAAVDL